MPTRYNIGTRICSQSMCVTVMEPRILAGHHIGYNVIRGCASSVFRHGRVPLGQTGQVKVGMFNSKTKQNKKKSLF
ncbi:unnamed protein product [Enterobius vermicularis]|uniref:Dynactin subunit 6 n=1 Tax=Enterobius vermicularis TaxID=51028 RepID=A0A0N4VQI4_ENTVE|nr:unnamed protein product [Enterobius vermicularis]